MKGINYRHDVMHSEFNFRLLQLRIPHFEKRGCFSTLAVADVTAGGIVDVPLAQTGEGIAECELLKWFVQEVSDDCGFRFIMSIFISWIVYIWLSLVECSLFVDFISLCIVFNMPVMILMNIALLDKM